MKGFFQVGLVLAAGCMFFQPTVESSENVTVDIRTAGSVPPVTRWYQCAAALEGKPLDQSAVDKCLKAILTNSPYLTGQTEREETSDGSTVVVFNLKAPDAILTEVEFEIPSYLRESLVGLVQKDSNALRTGDAYDYLKDSHTLMRYNFFLRANGLRGIVSRDLALNYSVGKAQLRYRLLQGPPTFPQEPLAPYGKSCSVMVRNVSETDIDDSTPLSLVEKYLHIREKACFSSDDLTRAEHELRSTGLFTSVSVMVTEDGGWRDLAVTVRTKTVTVREVRYKFYGLLPQSLAEHLPAVPFWNAKPYSRSDALVTRDTLLKAFAREGTKVQVCEDDETNDRGELVVTFHILGASSDKVIIDGKEIQN
jgi:hypothetical protein